MRTTLDPKVALVTGASSGIGRATALALSKAGATVAVGGRRTERLTALAQEAPGEMLVLDMDVSDPESVRKAVDRTVERLGTLDIVVNNAGVMLTGPVLGADPTEWTRMVETNLLGSMYTVHSALPHLLRSRGALVQISSTSGRVSSAARRSTPPPSSGSTPSPRPCARRSPSRGCASSSWNRDSSPPSWPTTSRIPPGVPRSSPWPRRCGPFSPRTSRPRWSTPSHSPITSRSTRSSYAPLTSPADPPRRRPPSGPSATRPGPCGRRAVTAGRRARSEFGRHERCLRPHPVERHTMNSRIVLVGEEKGSRAPWRSVRTV